MKIFWKESVMLLKERRMCQKQSEWAISLMNKYRKEKNNIWTINVVHAAAEKVQFAVNRLKLLHPF